MIPDWARKILGGRTDVELNVIAEREDARREVENTRWYRMLTERMESELRWVERELRTTDILHFQMLQAYGKSLEMVDGFIRASKNGSFAGELLSERVEKNRRKTVDEHMDEVLGVRS